MALSFQDHNFDIQIKVKRPLQNFISVDLTPVFKNCDVTDKENYGPISMSSIPKSLKN